MKHSGNHGNNDERARLIEKPELFCEHLLLHDLWSKQRDILQSIQTHQRTAVKACHASSKTFTAADALLWWITCHSEGIVVTTAPTWTQVEEQIWGHVRSAAQGARIAYPKPTTTSLRLGPNRYAIGLSTNEGVRFQGFHGQILIILDEAPGVLPEIWEAIEGIRAGGDVRVLALDNPVISSGPFYEAFGSNRDGWNLITISSFDTPNLAGLTLEQLLQMSDEELDQNSRPYLVTRRWVKEKYHEWGLQHPLWQARVLGQFPAQSEDALLNLSWLEAAKYRDGGDGPLFGGLDVAGPGEAETVLCVRRGPRIVLLKAWSNPDPRGDVLAALQSFKGQIDGLNVDSVGTGYYMALHLRDHDFPVRQVNVGLPASDPEKFFNLKAEYYWQLRLRCESGDIAGLHDEKTISQLLGIRYRYNSRGQIVIESKEEARRRGVKSPDRAEVVMLAFAENARKAPLINFLSSVSPHQPLLFRPRVRLLADW